MSTPVRRVTLAALVVVAVCLRGYRLGEPTLWVDEAESALNALTIVAEGLPRDHYQGQPLFENTMVRPWPDHPEYEFRDLSYSDRGLAVYHSWLPLYSIAAAFRLAGVSPDQARLGPPVPGTTRADLVYWTAVPRLPALLFSALFVVVSWALGGQLAGPSGALAGATWAATANFFVYAGRQARYYSAALAVDALCGLAIWSAWRRGRVVDHLGAGASIGLLFHVHSVSAIAMAVLYAACIPWLGRSFRSWVNVPAAGLTAAVMILPWAAWSGMLDQAVKQPAAWRYLDAAMAFWSLPSTNPLNVGMFVVGVAWLTLATRGIGPVHWREAILRHRVALSFACLWLVVSYLAFLLLMPAASFAIFRFRLVVAVPGALVLVIVTTAACQAWRPRDCWLPVAATAGLLLVTGQFPPAFATPPDPAFEALLAEVDTMQDVDRIYASPNDHLIFWYYTGRPVQSIAAVRRAWLERTGARDVILEAPRLVPLTPERLRDVSRTAGEQLTEAELSTAHRQAITRATALDAAATGAPVTAIPGVTPLALEAPLLAAMREDTVANVDEMTRGTPLGRLGMRDWWQFRQQFFLGYAPVERRDGDDLNYAPCRRRGPVEIHPSGFAIFRCGTERPLPRTGP